MDNRGSVLDLPTIMVMFFIIALSVLIAYKVTAELQTAIETSPINESETAVGVVESGRSALLSFDGLFVFMFIASCGAVIVGSFMIYTHPIFFAFSIFFFGVLAVIGVVLSNIYVEVATTSGFMNIDLMYPMTSFIMRNFVAIIIIMAFAVIVAMYSKSTAGGVVER